MRLTFNIFCLSFFLCKNSWARTLFLISHENRHKEALMLKQALKQKFNLPEEFFKLYLQPNCVANNKAIFHICIKREPKEEYKILHLNKKIMIDSFKELSEGRENAQ
jgi:hypothetical protein